MPTIDPRPRIDLLPLTDRQKDIFIAAVRSVLSNRSAFADAVQWLDTAYSIGAYRKRHEPQWERSRRHDERMAKCAPSIDELRALRGGGGYSPPCSWYRKSDESSETIRDENGQPVLFFDQEGDDKRRAESERFDPQAYAQAMHYRRQTLSKIEAERRDGRAVSQVERLELAMRDLAEHEMEIGADAELHARKLVLLAHLLVWHETCDDLGEFGRWPWDGSAIRLIAESPEEAKRLNELPPGRDRVLFHWFGFDKREVTVGAVLDEFVNKVEKAAALLGANHAAGIALKTVRDAPEFRGPNITNNFNGPAQVGAIGDGNRVDAKSPVQDVGLRADEKKAGFFHSIPDWLKTTAKIFGGVAAVIAAAGTLWIAAKNFGQSKDAATTSPASSASAVLHTRP
jgi:hypothetical protein